MEEQTINPNYQRGFNEGYLIAKHLPELADKLSQIKSEAPRMEGFRDGRTEFIQEKTKEHAPQWLKKDFANKEDNASLQSKDRTDKPKDLDKE